MKDKLETLKKNLLKDYERSKSLYNLEVGLQKGLKKIQVSLMEEITNADVAEKKNAHADIN